MNDTQPGRRLSALLALARVKGVAPSQRPETGHVTDTATHICDKKHHICIGALGDNSIRRRWKLIRAWFQEYLKTFVPTGLLAEIGVLPTAVFPGSGAVLDPSLYGYVRVDKAWGEGPEQKHRDR